MAINGLHGLFYTSEPEKLRAMLRDVFRFKSVDAGDGWLIFGMPPAELGVHPLEGENFEAGHRHLMSFMCDDITGTIAELRAKGVNVVGEPKDEGYGITTMLHLPGGCEVMLYEPRHPIAAAILRAAKRGRPNRAAKRRPAKRSQAKRSGPKKQVRRAKKARRRR
jgi:hypothetical protein